MPSPCLYRSLTGLSFLVPGMYISDRNYSKFTTQSWGMVFIFCTVLRTFLIGSFCWEMCSPKLSETGASGLLCDNSSRWEVTSREPFGEVTAWQLNLETCQGDQAVGQGIPGASSSLRVARTHPLPRASLVRKAVWRRVAPDKSGQKANVWRASHSKLRSWLSTWQVWVSRMWNH